MQERVKVWGPATVSNWGPGYDLLGAAVQGLGDQVEAWLTPGTGKVQLTAITGDHGKLPLDPQKNTAGVAAQATLTQLQRHDVDIVLSLHKGLPLGSGLGSSAASAVAAAWAVNVLCGQPLSREALLPSILQAEAAVSGWHADNAAPALWGGFVLIPSYEPLEILPLSAPDDLWLALVKPNISIATKEARALVPRTISLQQHIANSGHFAAMIVAICQKDTHGVGRFVRDQIVEPARAPLIPSFHQVQAAALAAGALGCSISGSGPTLFAVCASQETAHRVSTHMQDTFLKQAQLESNTHVVQVDNQGARVL